jgi:hypothetical protein
MDNRLSVSVRIGADVTFAADGDRLAVLDIFDAFLEAMFRASEGEETQAADCDCDGECLESGTCDCDCPTCGRSPFL